MVKVTIDLAALDRLTEAKATRGLQAAALRGEARLKNDLLSQPGSGRIYPRGKGRSHQASAPGEPPAPDTGELRRRTQADTQVRRDGDTLVGRVVVNTEYAAGLEVGTERVAPRPYLSRLRDDHADELHQAFIQGAKAG